MHKYSKVLNGWREKSNSSLTGISYAKYILVDSRRVKLRQHSPVLSALRNHSPRLSSTPIIQPASSPTRSPLFVILYLKSKMGPRKMDDQSAARIAKSRGKNVYSICDTKELLGHSQENRTPSQSEQTWPLGTTRNRKVRALRALGKKGTRVRKKMTVSRRSEG